MFTNTAVHARIDAHTKEMAVSVLDSIGLSMSDAVRILFSRIVKEQNFPFELEVPNATTRKAIFELEAGKGKKFKNAQALFEDLGI